jgi:hypothetical protein
MRVLELLTNLGGSETLCTRMVADDVCGELPNAKLAITPRTDPFV